MPIQKSPPAGRWGARAPALADAASALAKGSICSKEQVVGGAVIASDLPRVAALVSPGLAGADLVVRSWGDHAFGPLRSSLMTALRLT